MVKYKVGDIYTARQITNNQFYGIYDGLIALVDGQLEHLDAWLHGTIDEMTEEYPDLSEEEIYDEAFEDVLDNIPVAYENAKKVYVFKGIAPSGAFDVYCDYKCIRKENYVQK